MVTVQTRRMGIAQVFELLQECRSELYVDGKGCNNSDEAVCEHASLRGVESASGGRLHHSHIFISFEGWTSAQILERMRLYFPGPLPSDCAARMESASRRDSGNGTVQDITQWESLRRELEAALGLGACEGFRVPELARSCAFQSFHFSISAAVLSLFDGSSREDLENYVSLQEMLNEERIQLKQLSAPCTSTGQSCGLALAQAYGQATVARSPISPPEGCSENPLLPTPAKFPEICVWTNACDARLGVIRESLAARFGYLERAPIFAAMAGPPSVLVLRLRSIVAESVEELEDFLLDSESTDHARRRTIMDWKRACMGIAVLKVVDIYSADEMPSVAEAHLGSVVSEFNMSPVLVVLSTSHDTDLLLNVEGLRSACDKFNSRLHIEGAALMVAMQSLSLPNMAAGVGFAHSMMLEVAAWFGFSSCAVVTYHHADYVLSSLEPFQAEGTQQDNTSDTEQSDLIDKTCASGLTAGARNLIYGSEATSDMNLGPTLALWYFLSRMGLSRINSLVEQAKQLSEFLVAAAAKSTNLDACRSDTFSNVKITYVMSRADKLLRKYKAQQQVSNVNKAIFEDSSDFVGLLKPFLLFEKRQVWILYSPSRMVQAGQFSVPNQQVVENLVESLSATARRYEITLTASGIFGNITSKCFDLQLLSDKEMGSKFLLCYAAFRIVPEEISTTWRNTPESRRVVESLTSELVVRTGTVMRRFAEQSHLHSNAESLSGGSCPLRRAGPPAFQFYLHTDEQSRSPPFLTAEARDNDHPTNPVRDAETAASIIVELARKICSDWRTTSNIRKSRHRISVKPGSNKDVSIVQNEPTSLFGYGLRINHDNQRTKSPVRTRDRNAGDTKSQIQHHETLSEGRTLMDCSKVSHAKPGRSHGHGAKNRNDTDQGQERKSGAYRGTLPSQNHSDRPGSQRNMQQGKSGSSEDGSYDDDEGKDDKQEPSSYDEDDDSDSEEETDSDDSRPGQVEGTGLGSGLAQWIRGGQQIKANRRVSTDRVERGRSLEVDSNLSEGQSSSEEGSASPHPRSRTSRPIRAKDLRAKDWNAGRHVSEEPDNSRSGIGHVARPHRRYRYSTRKRESKTSDTSSKSETSSADASELNDRTAGSADNVEGLKKRSPGQGLSAGSTTTTPSVLGFNWLRSRVVSKQTARDVSEGRSEDYQSDDKTTSESSSEEDSDEATSPDRRQEDGTRVRRRRMSSAPRVNCEGFRSRGDYADEASPRGRRHEDGKWVRPRTMPSAPRVNHAGFRASESSEGKDGTESSTERSGESASSENVAEKGSSRRNEESTSIRNVFSWFSSSRSTPVTNASSQTCSRAATAESQLGRRQRLDDSRYRSSGQRHVRRRDPSTASSTSTSSSSEREARHRRPQREMGSAERDHYRSRHRHSGRGRLVEDGFSSNPEPRAESSAWPEWLLGRTQGVPSKSNMPHATHSRGSASSRSQRKAHSRSEK